MKTTTYSAGLIAAANAVLAAPVAEPLNLNLGGLGINIGGTPGGATTTKGATLPTLPAGGNVLNNLLDPILGPNGLLGGGGNLPTLPSITVPNLPLPTLPGVPSLPGGGSGGNLVNNLLDPILGPNGLLGGGNLPTLPSITVPNLPLPTLPGVPSLPGGGGTGGLLGNLGGVLNNLLPTTGLGGPLNGLFSNLFGNENGGTGNLLSTNLLGLQLDVNLNQPTTLLNLPPLAVVTLGGSGGGTTPQNPFTSTIDVRAVGSEVYNKRTYAPGPADAVGLFKFGLNGPLNTICYNITLFNIKSDYQSPWLTATHIHEGVRRNDGVPRIVFPNPVGDGLRKNSVGCITGPFSTGATDATGTDYGSKFQVSQIEANPKGFFADAHTVANRHGVVRGQLG